MTQNVDNISPQSLWKHLCWGCVSGGYLQEKSLPSNSACDTDQHHQVPAEEQRENIRMWQGLLKEQSHCPSVRKMRTQGGRDSDEATSRWFNSQTLTSTPYVCAPWEALAGHLQKPNYRGHFASAGIYSVWAPFPGLAVLLIKRTGRHRAHNKKEGRRWWENRRRGKDVECQLWLLELCSWSLRPGARTVRFPLPLQPFWRPCGLVLYCQ